MLLFYTRQWRKFDSWVVERSNAIRYQHAFAVDDNGITISAKNRLIIKIRKSILNALKMCYYSFHVNLYLGRKLYGTCGGSTFLFVSDCSNN